MYDPSTDSFTYGPDTSGTVTDSPGYNVLPDVSQTGPDSAPSTPTANGYGYYIDPAAQSSTTDLLKTALNWAIVRDQQKMGGYSAGGYGQTLPAGAQYSAILNAQQQKQRENAQGLLLLVVVGVVLMMHHE